MRSVRESRGLSLGRLSRLLDVEKESIRLWEHDRSIPRGDHLVTWAKVLDVGWDEVLDWFAAPGLPDPGDVRPPSAPPFPLAA